MGHREHLRSVAIKIELAGAEERGVRVASPAVVMNRSLILGGEYDKAVRLPAFIGVALQSPPPFIGHTKAYRYL